MVNNNNDIGALLNIYRHSYIFITIFRFILPFIINFSSALIIIFLKTKQQVNISLVSSSLTLIIFVLPLSTYKQAFRTVISQFLEDEIY